MNQILISPGKYIQGKGTLNNLKEHIGYLGNKFFVLITENGHKRFADKIKSRFDESELEFILFNGECSKNEINRLREKLKTTEANVVIGVGGGKVHDTAKALAHFENKALAIIPTVASTDAPTSALSVIYTDEGVFEEYLFTKNNPNIVLIDLDAIVNAPVRLLVAGMGDALATKFEARSAIAANAPAMAGGKSTMAAKALADLSYDILLEEGLKAKLAVERNVVTKAVEKIVEASTLLSGLGFESSGLAASHAIHDAFTSLKETSSLYHGELVAFGVLTHLVLENAPLEEIIEVICFCEEVGLPTTLEDLNIKEINEEDLRKVAEIATAEGSTIHNMPFAVTADDVYAAILTADALGTEL